jgi:hypothetical protein
MKHERFIYHSYTIDENGLGFSYRFSMDNPDGGSEHEFRPRWTCGIPLTDDPVLHELIFSLGMVELISYWKSACPPVVEVRCGSLDDWQIQWWKKLYRNGLGEFFYVNGITPTDDFMRIIADSKQMSTNSAKVVDISRGCLIPVGGGKDSIVTLELLRDSMEDNLCYIVGDIKRARDSAVTAGYSDSQILRVKRTIDPALLQLNKLGYLNGHTPFSAVIAFSSLIFAYLSGKKYIVLSNESSADEGNIAHSGESDTLQVNHQYSKSTEFERDFRDYVSRLNERHYPAISGLPPRSRRLPEYFSLLRPWNELQITRKFAQFPQYFPIFQSCNVGTKTNTWCCNCAKCLYVYIMLAAFTEESELNRIFGENLLTKPELNDLFISLKNPEHDKPFECVGTREEVNHALFMICNNRNIPPDSDLLTRFNSDNFVPEELLPLLRSAIK